MKPWASRLVAHVDEWSKRHPRNWVPRFVYHFTDVTNAASVLNRGALYSRRRAEQLGCMAVDQASAKVIAQTRGAQRYVRLYFRPLTPTQFYMEGIRPPDEPSKYDAHCPVPIFFCFDFVKTVGMDEARFSDGNMAANNKADHGDTEEFFDQLPFESIYHDGHVVGDNEHSIVFHRNAEVLVPDELPLNHKLRQIVCRSDAERLTLLHLLSANARLRWGHRVSVGAAGFFRSRRWHIKNVKAGEGTIDVQLRGAPGSIDLTYSRQLARGRVGPVLEKLRPWQSSWQVQARNRYDGEVTIHLAGHLAFQAVVVLSDAPF